MSTKHPLVGKKLVAVNPQRGEVTQEQIKATFEEVAFNRPNSWIFETAKWTVTLDHNSVITDVTKT